MAHAFRAARAANDPTHAQRVRIRRWLLAVATYAFNAAAAAGVAQIGLGEVPPAFWWQFIGVAVAINVVLGLVFATGWNLRFPDPSLTGLQIVLSAGWGMLALYAMPNARPLILMFFVPAFCFGMLQLPARAYYMTAVAVMAVYATMLLVDHATRPGFDLRHELFVFGLFGALLAWLAWFGSIVDRIRRDLRRRTHELEEANRLITEHSITDDLTSLANRRHAMAVLRRSVALAERQGMALSVALLDVDHFKRINDRHGHQAGDAVLRELAHRMRDALRDSDHVLPAPAAAATDGTGDDRMLARLGGEEFLVLMPGTTLAQAATTMERLAQRVRALPVEVPTPVEVSFSAGVAQHRRGETVDELLHRADAAMYRAKSLGRQRIECDGGALPSPQAG